MKTRIWVALCFAILLSMSVMAFNFSPSPNVAYARGTTASVGSVAGYEIDPQLLTNYPSNDYLTWNTTFGLYIMDKKPYEMSFIDSGAVQQVSRSMFWINTSDTAKVLNPDKIKDCEVLVSTDTSFQIKYPVTTESETVGWLTVTYGFFKDYKPKISVLYENILLSEWQIIWCLLPTKTYLKTSGTFAQALSVETVNFGSKVSAELGDNDSPQDWQLWCSVTWDDYGQAIVYGGWEKVFGSKGITIVFPINETFIDPSVQVEHVYYWQNPSFQRRNFYANSYFWQFYVDEWDYDFCYESSADGETWGNKVAIYGGGDPYTESMRSTEAGVYLETDTLVHMVYANYNSERPGGSRHTIFYRTGTLGEGSISLGTQYVVCDNIDGFNAPTVTVDSNGYPWVGYNIKNTGYFVKKATATSGATWGSQTQLFTPDACSFMYHSGVIIPLDAGKMYVVWEDNHPGEASDDGAHGRLYTGSTWEASRLIWRRSDLRNTHHNKMRYSVVVKSNHDIIYFRDARYTQTNGDVNNNGTWVYEYDYSGDSWSRIKQVSTEGTAGFVTINKATEDMWFFYTHTNAGDWHAGDGIYYMKYTDSTSTWGSEITVDATATGINHLHGFYEQRDGYLGIAYVRSDWLYFTTLVDNESPTIGEFQAPATAYANQYSLLNASINDDDGVADFDYATIEISNSVILKWTESTNVFSEQSDSNGYCTLDAENSVRTSVNSTAYQLSWKIKLTWTYPEGSKSVIVTNTEVYDDSEASGSGSSAGLFTFEDDLIIHTDAVVDDSRVNPSDTVTFTATIYYEGTSTAPEDVTGITAYVELDGVQKGSDADVSGGLSIAFSAESDVAEHAYNVFATTDQNTETNKTVNVIVDRIEIYSQALNDSRTNIDESIEFRVQARLDYDNHALGDGDSLTANSGVMAWNGTGSWFKDSKIQSTASDYTFTVSSGSEATYGITTIYIGVSNPKGVWDKLIVTISPDSYGPDVGIQVNFTLTAIYDYDDVVVGSSAWTVNVLRNTTHFDSGNFTDTQESEIVYEYTTENVTETTYGLTAFTSNTVIVTWGDLVIEIYEISVTDTRINIDADAYLYFHSRFSGNQSDCTGGTLYVNGTDYAINGTGWAVVSPFFSDAGKRIYVVTGVNVGDETDYQQIPSNPEVIWDSLTVTISVGDNRVDINVNASITVTAVRDYDLSAFDGTLTLNNTNYQYATVQRQNYTTSSASGGTYGITVMSDSGSGYVIWDSVSLSMTDPTDQTINVNQNATGMVVTGIYDYDSTNFDGAFTLNYTTYTHSTPQKQGYTVSSLSGDTHGITVISINDETYCIWSESVISPTSYSQKRGTNLIITIRCEIGDSYADGWIYVYVLQAGEVVKSENITIVDGIVANQNYSYPRSYPITWEVGSSTLHVDVYTSGSETLLAQDTVTVTVLSESVNGGGSVWSYPVKDKFAPSDLETFVGPVSTEVVENAMNLIFFAIAIVVCFAVYAYFQRKT